MLTSALAALLLLGAPAGLEDHTDFAAGKAFYADLEFEQAIVRFRIASADANLNPAEQATVQLWIGVTYGGMGDNDAARSAFKNAFALNIDATLPELTPPTLIPIADEERKALVDARAASAKPAVKPSPLVEDPIEDAPSAGTTESANRDPPALAEEAQSEPGTVPWLLIGGGATAAGGLLIVVGAAAVTSYGVYNYLFAIDSSHFQSEADAANVAMNVAFATAGGMTVVALALLGGGAALAVTSIVVE